MHPARLLIQTVSFGFIVLAVLNPAAAQYAGKGEHVTVVRANGFEIPGRAMSMSDRRIQFRSSRGGVMSFHGSELREVRTQTDTFTWDGKQNRFASAKVAAAKAGPAKLRGTWCGFLRYLPAGAVTSGFDHLSKYQHALCMMYVDKVNGSSASGTLVIPGHKYKTSVTLVCKPLADNRREKDVRSISAWKVRWEQPSRFPPV